MAFNWHRQHKDNLSLGQMAADKMRNMMGSWRFVFGFLGFMGLWATLNTVAFFAHWDVYPFILLNLLLSTLAGLQGAILLIAAKRADEISAALAQHDYETNLQAEKEIALNNDMTATIKDLVTEVHELVVKQNGKDNS